MICPNLQICAFHPPTPPIFCFLFTDNTHVKIIERDRRHMCADLGRKPVAHGPLWRRWRIPLDRLFPFFFFAFLREHMVRPIQPWAKCSQQVDKPIDSITRRTLHFFLKARTISGRFPLFFHDIRHKMWHVHTECYFACHRLSATFVKLSSHGRRQVGSDYPEDH